MNNKEQEPTLYFFRTKPENMISFPPLASSLQSLESSFFLIALERYPHAHIACASAIESALKAGLKKSPKDWGGLKQLTDQARSRGLRSSELEPLKNFRDLRNEMMHHGFSPKDNVKTAASLLEDGFRYLAECYKEFFNFDLYDGLLVEFAAQLAVAEEVYSKAKEIPELDLTYCFRAFGHLLRWSIKDSLMAHWEFQSALDADEWGGKFDACQELKDKLERRLDPPAFLDCPICDEPESLVCQLDDDKLDDGEISVKQAQCVNCGLTVPLSCPYLADVLCRKQIEEKREEILQDYGIPAVRPLQ